MFAALLMILFAGTTALAPAAQAQITIYVDTSATGANDGSSWNDAYVHLQDALDRANANASEDFEILVATGIYQPDEDSLANDGVNDGSESSDHTDGNAGERFTISENNVKLFGGYPPGGGTRDPQTNRTILSGDLNGDDIDPDNDGIVEDADPNQDGTPENLQGQNTNSVLYLDGNGTDITNKTVLDGLYVTGGHADGGEGGGLYCYGKSSNECSPILKGVVFSGNAANQGGAIYNWAQDGIANPTITNSTFIGNAAGRGGAMHNVCDTGGTSSPTIINTVFVRNAVSSRGGAIENDPNSNGTSRPTITNATFVGNTAANTGGAIFNDGGSSTLDIEITNTILWGNRASAGGDDGDEIYNNSASATINHSIVEAGDNGIVNSTAFSDGTANLKKVPLLEYAPKAAGDDRTFATDDDGLHVTPGSPAIDAGDNTAVPSGVSTDLTGRSRIQNSTVDIGAYEGGRDQERTIYVDPTASGAANGTSWADADTTLQDTANVGSGALGYATGNDEIRIAEGVYTPQKEDTSFTITGVQDSLEVYGGYPTGGGGRDPSAHPTVLSGDINDDDNNKTGGVTPTAADIAGNDNAHHVLVLDGTSNSITGATVIDGVTITAGEADGAIADNEILGGGVYCGGNGSGNECSPTLRTVTVIGNRASEGGGIYHNGQNGGTTDPRITGATFVGNSAVRGGAIYNNGDDGTSSPRIANAVFANNSADRGGAIHNFGRNSGTSSPQVINATFTGNSVDLDGGAMYNDGNSGTSSPQIANAILWGNSAGGSGAEIYNDAATPSLSHTIIESGIPGISENNGSSTTDDGGNLALNPQFSGAGALTGDDGTLATVDDSLVLGYDSPAFDAGTNAALDTTGDGSRDLTTDLTGAARVQDLDGDGTATVNIGAYEAVEPAPPTASMKRVLSVTGAGVSGTVNPRGAAASVRLRLYPTGNPDRDTLLKVGTRTGAATQRVEATARSLTPTTEYTAELETENAEGGPVTGALTFETPPVPALKESDDENTIEMTYTTPGTGPVLTDTSVFARKGGEDTYQSLSVSTLEGFSEGTEGELRVSAQLSGSTITTRGVDYYVVVEEDADRYTVPVGGAAPASDRPLHVPVSFDELSPPDSITFEKEAYRLVSVPASGDIKAKLTESLGDYDPAEWRALQWDAGTGQYTEFPDLSTESFGPGRGFWVVSKRGLRPSLSEGTTVDASTPTTVPLQAGWNQIGAPFGFTVPWDTVQAASGLSAAEVDGPYAFREREYTREAALVPWRGYFVFSAEADTLVVPPVGTSASQTASSRTPAKASKKAEEDYTLTVEAVTDGARSETRLGVQLSALEEIGDKAVAHAQSAKPLSTEGKTAGQTWTLRLSAPAEEGRSVRLQWREKGTVPKGGEVYLLDQMQERRLTEGAELELEAGETRRLKAIVGTRGYAEAKSKGIELSELETGLRAGYPNPFEEAATIEYVLSEKQEVTIAVYDVLGRRIRTLVEGKKESYQIREQSSGLSVSEEFLPIFL